MLKSVMLLEVTQRDSFLSVFRGCAGKL